MNLTAYIAAAVLIAAAAIFREIIVHHSKGLSALEEDELLKRLRVELKRADRFQYNAALVIVDFKGSFSQKSARKLLSKVAPDQILQEEMREYDLIIRADPNLLYLIIPYKSDTDIKSVMQERISNIAADRKWTNHRIAIAIYPEDGNDANELRDRCLKKLDKNQI